MDDLIIRRATPEDAVKILEYLNQIGGESDNLLFGFNEFDMPVEKEKSFLESINKSNNSIMLIGMIEDEVVSIASLQGFNRKRIAHRGNMAISVKKKFWHSGIATRMITELKEFAQKAGISVIELEVRLDNVNAVALYEKMGFEKIGTYKNFLKINEKFYDCYLMNLYL